MALRKQMIAKPTQQATKPYINAEQSCIYRLVRPSVDSILRNAKTHTIAPRKPLVFVHSMLLVSTFQSNLMLGTMAPPEGAGKVDLHRMTIFLQSKQNQSTLLFSLYSVAPPCFVQLRGSKHLLPCQSPWIPGVWAIWAVFGNNMH